MNGWQIAITIMVTVIAAIISSFFTARSINNSTTKMIERSITSTNEIVKAGVGCVDDSLKAIGEDIKITGQTIMEAIKVDGKETRGNLEKAGQKVIELIEKDGKETRETIQSTLMKS